MLLLEQHLADLRESGLSDATIRESGAYSESDPSRVQELLRWRSPALSLGPCLVLPHGQINGELSGFCCVKPSKPRSDKTKDGKPIKYEHPVGHPRSPHFTIGAIEANCTPGLPIAITEGWKKSEAINQAGIGCIGLPGVNAWSWKREGGKPRELIDELVEFGRRGRLVLIIFDTDDRYNPDVNREAAELTRALTSCGAIVACILLPLGPNGEKTGADDFIARHGEDAFLQLVWSQVRRQQPTIALRNYREQMAAQRRNSVGHPGIYLDTSPTGSGKSTADIEGILQAGSSLTVLPTHNNCREVANTYRKAGIQRVAAYPKLEESSCQNYEDASKAEQHGLSAMAAVCPSCEFRENCCYHKTLDEAEKALHRIATHTRAGFRMAHLAEGRNYIAIHEDLIKLLRRSVTASGGFDLVAAVLNKTKHEWDFGSHYDLFLFRMMEAAEALEQHIAKGVNGPVRVPSAEVSMPRGIDAALFRAMKDFDIWPPAEAMRICRDIATGELTHVTARNGGIVAVYQTQLPDDVPVWIADATGNANLIRQLVGREVIHVTSTSRIEQQHPVLQIPHDITRATAAKKVAEVVTAIVSALPRDLRIGVICDSKHKPVISGRKKRLPQSVQSRIVEVSHFRSGQSRGSNDWIDKCDALLVLGTPRVPPKAIADHLQRLGATDAAALSEERAGWGPDSWLSVGCAGEFVVVKSRGYRDWEWRAAHRDIVRAELQQAIGRGRSICDHGIPVIVVTNEPLGVPLTSFDITPKSESQQKIYNTLRELHATRCEELSEPSAKNILGSSSVNPPDLQAVPSKWIAERLGITDRAVRKTLAMLEAWGDVSRVGERGGWIPLPPRIIDLGVPDQVICELADFHSDRAALTRLDHAMQELGFVAVDGSGVLFGARNVTSEHRPAFPYHGLSTGGGSMSFNSNAPSM